MISDIWNIISKFLEIKDISTLLKMKIISNQYICKICSFKMEIIMDDYIYYKYTFFDRQFGIEKTVKRKCGLYINNICNICCHNKHKKNTSKLQTNILMTGDQQQVLCHYRKENFQLGQRVFSRYLGNKGWYLGVVSKVNNDGTYRVDYDGGKVELRVKYRHMRRDHRHSMKAKKNFDI